jgi:hypothetical protein
MSAPNLLKPLDDDDLSLAHLWAELARIDVLVQRAVVCWQMAGQDPADRFRGLHITDAEARLLLERPLGSSWGETVSLEPDVAQSFSVAYEEASAAVRAIEAIAADRGQVLRLQALATAFDLDPFAVDVLLICLAPALDLRYERLYGYLQDDVTQKLPRVNLILDLLVESDPTKRLKVLSNLSEEGPLFQHSLLTRVEEPDQKEMSLLSQPLHIDNAVASWLLGKYHPHVELEPNARLLVSEESEADTLLAGGHVGLFLARFEALERPILVFYGVDRAAQAATARVLAARLGRSLLDVDLEQVVGTGVHPRRAICLSLRDARLTGAIAFLHGWDVCLDDTGALLPGLLSDLCMHPDAVLVAGKRAWQAKGIDRDRVLLWQGVPSPTYSHRQELWRYFVSRLGFDEAVDVEPLAGHFDLTTDQIRDAVATARDAAIQRDGSISVDDLFTAARLHSSPGLSRLARKIEPRYTWDDIVLPSDQRQMLHELVNTVRGRTRVLEDWGIGKKLASSEGITVLFSGPPGTGKTMSAEIIASELGLDLFKIDLSTVVSKYIGETEKNLERIFGEAENSNAILFFDEADAIFGKRSEVKDAHDRYANVEVSYLLQRMEAYNGVTILATNLRANLDEAFTRRLQFAIDFPFPDERYRVQIWQALFPEALPRDPDIDFAPLARRFRLAGGNIRNIIVSAAYLAAANGGQVSMRHLLHGTRRELQKMGRLVNESDMDLGS